MSNSGVAASGPIVCLLAKSIELIVFIRLLVRYSLNLTGVVFIGCDSKHMPDIVN